MTYDVEVGGRRRSVTVEPTGRAFRVTVDGHLHVVDLWRRDGQFSMLVVEDGSGRVRSHDVGIGEIPGGDLAIYVDGARVAARVSSSSGRWARRGGEDDGAGPSGPVRVTAPMPGKITRVLVASGDEVRARQGLVVVEAMKMENELRSPKDGRVKEVRAAEGTTVEAGAVLVVVE